METNNAAPRPRADVKLFLALALLLAGSILTGFLFALIGSFFYLIFLFPIGMGLAGAMIASKAVEMAGLEKPRQVLLACLLAAIVIYGSFHYGRYVALQVQTYLLMTQEDVLDGREPSLAFAKFVVSYGMKQETGYGGFLGYMIYKAREGMSIGRFYEDDRLELKSWLVVLFWALEFALIAWIATGPAREKPRRTLAGERAKAPVCESCGKPLGKDHHLGGTTPENEALLLDLVRQNDLAGLGRLLGKSTSLPSVEVYMKRCEACSGSSAYLTICRISRGTKGSILLKDLSRSTLTPDDSMLFLSQLSFKAE